MAWTKAIPLATTAALLLAGLSLFAQQNPNMPPSFAAITPGSIRAAGTPSGPLPPRHIVGPPLVVRPHHHRPRNGFAGSGFGYGIPYAVPYGYYDDQPDQPEQPAAPQEPEKPGLTIFEHNGKAIDQGGEVPAAQAPPVQQPVPPPDEKPGPTTILVFRDGHQQEVQNYAILGDKLIVLSDERAKRIPLAELDLDATIKANDDQGVDFRLPGKS